MNGMKAQCNTGHRRYTHIDLYALDGALQYMSTKTLGV
jgi:hypothetical protein